MKKYLVAAAAAAVVFGMSASDAKAANAAAQSNTGCGLGAVLIQNNDSLLAQLAMTLLNGTCGNGTFGITSGTSNCKKADKIASNEVNTFVASNMDNLASDIAMGSGESLSTLAELMNVPTAERGEFFATLQSNFSNIYTSENVEAADVIDNIVAVTKG
ncbi:MAG: DUF3015 domain-containing protein [Deltaproteobacteria bacterium]|nr:DUF3015 domain-containing protein [Deltaproteobacteria bacterium]